MTLPACTALTSLQLSCSRRCFCPLRSVPTGLKTLRQGMEWRADQRDGPQPPLPTAALSLLAQLTELELQINMSGELPAGCGAAALQSLLHCRRLRHLQLRSHRDYAGLLARGSMPRGTVVRCRKAAAR